MMLCYISSNIELGMTFSGNSRQLNILRYVAFQNNSV